MRQILIMAILMLQSFAASAQSNIEKVFKIVLHDPSVEILANTDYNVVCLDSAPSYCKFTEFTIPVKKKKLFAQIEKELLLEKANAYDVFIKDAADPMRRHAYLAIWFNENNKYHCYYYHIYGVIPARLNELKLDGNSKFKFDSLPKSMTRRTQTVIDDNRVTTTTYDDEGNVRVVKSHPLSEVTNDVKTDIDFMLMFGNLRVAFLDAIKDADAKTLQTGIVVKIARLCKEHNKLLTDNEKKTCISNIDEMKNTLKKVNSDSFLDGVLQEARIALEK